MASPITLFIVEGETRDLRFAKEMEGFMGVRSEMKFICLPAEQNIYMLYKRLADDGFDTDVVEVLRESVPTAAACLKGVSRDSVDQVYLFFDYDPHQDNISDGNSDILLASVIAAFDNENESGKLYISYPMVEALYDYRVEQCQTHSGCFIDRADIPSYKRLSGDRNPNASKHMGAPEWKDLIACFVLRCKCLLNMDEVSFDSYREQVTVEALFHEERELLRREGRVFVLSAFPEFLLDYFGAKFFNARARLHKLKFNECPREHT